jgi:hypothetical protein
MIVNGGAILSSVRRTEWPIAKLAVGNTNVVLQAWQVRHTLDL